MAREGAFITWRVRFQVQRERLCNEMTTAEAGPAWMPAQTLNVLAGENGASAVHLVKEHFLKHPGLEDRHAPPDEAGELPRRRFLKFRLLSVRAVAVANLK